MTKPLTQSVHGRAVIHLSNEGHINLWKTAIYLEDTLCRPDVGSHP
jgi:hypothetical protein